MLDRTAPPTIKPTKISWWMEEALASERDAPETPALRGAVDADVTVVGGGFTGLWTALLLKERKPGLRVALIEAQICGAGASGMNGGKVHGYWGALRGLAATVGPDGALEAARLGTMAQDAMRAFCTTPGRDVWWRESGNLRVSTSEAQDGKLELALEAARSLGVADTAVRLDKAELDRRIRSPKFRGGIFFPEGANLHPGRLARELRKACIQAGVSIFEHTRMTRVEEAEECVVHAHSGQIRCKQVALATNVALAAHPWAAAHLAVFSSYAVMSEPISDIHERIGWRADEGVADMRMFLHYFRKAQGDRILMGSGSGPIAFNAQYNDPAMNENVASAARAQAALWRLLPGLRTPPIAKAWGGGIDISADRLPFFKSSPKGRVHIGCGYSGHGVNATRIGGECLSSLILGERNAWTESLFCRRQPPRFPPEPFKTVGGRLVRAAILSCEEAEDRGVRPGLGAQLGAWLPRALNIKVGMR